VRSKVEEFKKFSLAAEVEKMDTSSDENNEFTKHQSANKLKEEGGRLFKDKNFEGASKIGRIAQQKVIIHTLLF
jgi:hypothetical protein